MGDDLRKPGLPLPEVKDEPGMAERFQRGLRRALNTPHKPHPKPKPKPKLEELRLPKDAFRR